MERSTRYNIYLPLEIATVRQSETLLCQLSDRFGIDETILCRAPSGFVWCRVVVFPMREKVRTRVGDLLVRVRRDAAVSDVRGLQERHHGHGGLPEPDHAP